MGVRYAAVPDGESAFSPLIMRTTTVGPGEKYGGGKEARHTPQRLEGLASVVAKFHATNGEELKFELQRASGLEQRLCLYASAMSGDHRALGLRSG